MCQSIRTDFESKAGRSGPLNRAPIFVEIVAARQGRLALPFGGQRSLSDFVDAGRGHKSPWALYMITRGLSPRKTGDFSNEPRLGFNPIRG